MKIHIDNFENYTDRIGGGFTFLRSLLSNFDVDLDSKVYFSPNPMQTKEIPKNKRIILRMDNIPEEKNNRGCSASKLISILPQADTIIFQSEWSQQKYVEFAELNGIKITDDQRIIYNGADTKIFYPENYKKDNVYLYVHGKGDNKRWQEAQEIYRRIFYQNQKSVLYIVGNMSGENRQYDFGFYNNENYKFLGIQVYHGLADIMRASNYLIYPAFADSCPNTLIEALNCGLEVIGLNQYGGQKEVFDKFQTNPEVFTLEHMIEEYRKVFDE
jgi:hypothetical protein